MLCSLSMLGQHTRGKLAEAWNMCLAVVIEISLATTDQWEQLIASPSPHFGVEQGFGGIFLVDREIEWASNPCVHRTDLAPSWNTQTHMKSFLLLYNKTFFLAFLSFFIFSFFVALSSLSLSMSNFTTECFSTENVCVVYAFVTTVSSLTLHDLTLS